MWGSRGAEAGIGGKQGCRDVEWAVVESDVTEVGEGVLSKTEWIFLFLEGKGTRGVHERAVFYFWNEMRKRVI